jgi:hypothetical protein
VYKSEGYVILNPTQLLIPLLLILADRQHVSALFKLPSSGLPVDSRYPEIRLSIQLSHWGDILV